MFTKLSLLAFLSFLLHLASGLPNAALKPNLYGAADFKSTHVVEALRRYPTATLKPRLYGAAGAKTTHVAEILRRDLPTASLTPDLHRPALGLKLFGPKLDGSPRHGPSATPTSALPSDTPPVIPLPGGVQLPLGPTTYVTATATSCPATHVIDTAAVTTPQRFATDTPQGFFTSCEQDCLCTYLASFYFSSSSFTLYFCSFPN